MVQPSCSSDRPGETWCSSAAWCEGLHPRQGGVPAVAPATLGDDTVVPALAAIFPAVFAALWASDRSAVLEMGHSAWGVTDYFRDGGIDLLTRAYRALVRDALAEIAEVHAAHRDLRSVQVLTAP
ncbi:hypothetical protein [Actinoplanes sp. NPDC049802]|uniref:hypothetical protein n=1 Tax=Actinoplanes sp. NPDC049802 TaxID=3154742 RepID=UPI0033D18CBA